MKLRKKRMSEREIFGTESDTKNLFHIRLKMKPILAKQLQVYKSKTSNVTAPTCSLDNKAVVFTLFT